MINRNQFQRLSKAFPHLLEGFVFNLVKSICCICRVKMQNIEYVENTFVCIGSLSFCQPISIQYFDSYDDHCQFNVIFSFLLILRENYLKVMLYRIVTAINIVYRLQKLLLTCALWTMCIIKFS